HHRGPGPSGRRPCRTEPTLGWRQPRPRNQPCAVPPLQHRQQQPGTPHEAHRGNRGRAGHQGNQEPTASTTRRRARYVRRRRRPGPRLRFPPQHTDRGRCQTLRPVVPGLLLARCARCRLMVRSLDSRLAGDTRAKPMVAQRLRVLIVGDFSASKVGNASVAEQLAVKLSAAGDVVHTTSAKTNRLARVTGMIIDTARFRQTVDVGIVDVYAGRGFLWAEWTTAILKSANKPVIHVLRSGSLPDFAAAQPERVRRLFAASDSVVALSGYLSESV